jgi:hypothetical protein
MTIRTIRVANKITGCITSTTTLCLYDIARKIEVRRLGNPTIKPVYNKVLFNSSLVMNYARKVSMPTIRAVGMK